MRELTYLGDRKFGSGEGITANYFARKNEVIAIEPSEDMLANAWKYYKYEQIVGDVHALSVYPDESFDIIICHNVLEYRDIALFHYILLKKS